MTASGSPPSPSRGASVIAVMSTNTDSKCVMFTGRCSGRRALRSAGRPAGRVEVTGRKKRRRHLNRGVVLCVIVGNGGRVVWHSHVREGGCGVSVGAKP